MEVSEMLKKSVEFTGLYPAMIVGFNKDDTVDLEGLKENVRYLMSVGCSGMCISGSTGEAAFLTRQERIDVIKAAKEAVGDGKIIAGVGAQSTKLTMIYAQDALKAGADALLVLSPIGNTTPDGMVAHFKEIAKLGAPIVMYNHPAATNIFIDNDMFDRLIQIPEVIGMKETSGSMALVNEINRKYKDSNITLFTGCDDLTLPALATGFKAVILATANVAPKQVLAIMDAVNKGDLNTARTIYQSLAPLTNLIGAEPNFPAGVKKAVELLGRPSSDPRLPILPFPEEKVPELKEAMRIAGVLD